MSKIKPSVTVKVSAELLLHTELEELIQRTFDEHGIMVQQIALNWQNQAKEGEPASIKLNNINMSTQALCNHEPATRTTH